MVIYFMVQWQAIADTWSINHYPGDEYGFTIYYDHGEPLLKVTLLTRKTINFKKDEILIFSRNPGCYYSHPFENLEVLSGHW